MKALLILTAAIAFFSFGTCKKESVLPDCIQQKIDAIKAQPKWNPPATVEEYNYNGKRVFVFSSPCCDQFNEAFDEACNYICAPSGGFTGRGDGKCGDFKEKATLMRVVWKDE